MKKQIFVATIVVALLSAGVYFYTKTSKLIEPPIPQFDTKLVGTWKIDTAYNIKDSNSLSTLISLLFKDSTVLRFKSDSVVETITTANNKTDTAKYYTVNNLLFIKSGSATDTMALRFIGADKMELEGKDSSVTNLSRISVE